MTYTHMHTYTHARNEWNENKIGENETHSTEQRVDLKLNYKRLMIKLHNKCDWCVNTPVWGWKDRQQKSKRERKKKAATTKMT